MSQAITIQKKADILNMINVAFPNEYRDILVSMNIEQPSSDPNEVEAILERVSDDPALQETVTLAIGSVKWAASMDNFFDEHYYLSYHIEKMIIGRLIAITDPMIDEHIYSLNRHKMTDVMLNDHYNYNVNALVESVTKTLINMYIKDSDKIRLHLWLTNCHYLAQGGVGVVLSTSPSPLYAIKSLRYAQNTEDIASLRHEYLTSLLCLNNLRNFIPNFNYSYGYFECSQVLTNNKQLGDWCSSDGNVVYTMNELIINRSHVNGMTFFQKAQTLSEIDNLKVYFQVIFALEIAHQMYDFTHYDLHGSNVLVDELDHEIVIEYPRRGKIRTKYVAVIIDFGFAHFRYNEINFYSRGHEHIGVINRSYPAYDIWKLTCDIARLKGGAFLTFMEFFVNRPAGLSDKDYIKDLTDITALTDNVGYPYDVSTAGTYFQKERDKVIAQGTDPKSLTQKEKVISSQARFVGVKSSYLRLKDVTYTLFLDAIQDQYQPFLVEDDVPEQESYGDLVTRLNLNSSPVVPSSLYAFDDMLETGVKPEILAQYFQPIAADELEHAKEEFDVRLTSLIALMDNLTAIGNRDTDYIYDLLKAKNEHKELEYIFRIISYVSALYGKTYITQDDEEALERIKIVIGREVSTTNLVTSETMTDSVAIGKALSGYIAPPVSPASSLSSASSYPITPNISPQQI